MPLDAYQLAGIKANTALVFEKLGPLSRIDFCFDRASVEWVQGYIERLRANRPDLSTNGNIVSVIGSYLGDAIIDAAGGFWDELNGGQVGIRFTDTEWCFPFSKVRKQFENGLEGGDSILSFYTVAIDIAAGKLNDREQPQQS